jgi:hypothetical protein
MALKPIMSSLKGADLSDPRLAPVFAAVQAQVRTLKAAPPPAPGAPANPALATKYLAANILGDFQLPATRSQVSELSRAYHDSLPGEQQEKIRADLIALHMESMIHALGQPAAGADETAVAGAAGSSRDRPAS